MEEMIGNIKKIENVFVCLVGWFGFMPHQPLQVINTKSIYIYTNSSVLYKSKTVLFQTNQVSIQKQVYFKQFSLASIHSLVLFDP